MANLRDIAAKSGVSLTTASRIINEDQSFSCKANTKERVLAAARQLNYLSKKKKKRLVDKYQIGIILAITSEKYSDPFFSTVLNSIEAQCAVLGATVAYLKNYNEILFTDTLQELLAAKLTGLIVMEELPEAVIKVLKRHIPAIVAIDSNIHRFDSVGFDYIDSTFQALNHLKSLGHRRIAYIGGTSGRRGFDESKRLIAYREWLRTNDIPYEKELVIDCHWDIEECALKIEKLISSPSCPDAVFAGNDTLGSVVLGKIFELNIRCPQEISVVGFNNIPISAHTVPSMTTVELDATKIGEIALKQLLSRIENNCYYGSNPIRIYLDTQLIKRNSTSRKENI